MTSGAHQDLQSSASRGKMDLDPFAVVERLDKCLLELDALSKLIGDRPSASADIAARQLLRIAASIARKGVDAAVAFGHIAVTFVAAMPVASAPVHHPRRIADRKAPPTADLGFAIVGIISDTEALSAALAIARERASDGGVTAASALACMREIRRHLDALHTRVAEAAGTWWASSQTGPLIRAATTHEAHRVHVIALSAMLNRIDPGRCGDDRAGTMAPCAADASTANWP